MSSLTAWAWPRDLGRVAGTHANDGPDTSIFVWVI